MDEVLDLDALLPQARKVKIHGKLIDAFPPTLRQAIQLQRIGTQVIGGNLSEEEAVKVLMDTLVPLVPALAEDKTIDFTFEQLVVLVEFLQKQSIPKTVAKTPYSAEKKTDSLEPLPSSSTTTPDTE